MKKKCLYCTPPSHLFLLLFCSSRSAISPFNWGAGVGGGDDDFCTALYLPNTNKETKKKDASLVCWGQLWGQTPAGDVMKWVAERCQSTITRSSSFIPQLQRERQKENQSPDIFLHSDWRLRNFSKTSFRWHWNLTWTPQQIGGSHVSGYTIKILHWLKNITFLHSAYQSA